MHLVPINLEDSTKPTVLTRSLPGQFFPGCHLQVGLGFAEVQAGYRCCAGVWLSYVY